MPFRAVEPNSIPAQHPVAHLRDAWPSLSGPGGYACWLRFDPLDFPRVLPWVMLLRQQDPAQPERFTYMVCGEGCRQAFGFSYQGKVFGEDLPAAAVSARLREFASIRAGAGPLYSTTPLPLPDREFVEVYRGVFGLSSDGAWIDRFLIVLAPVNVRLAARRATMVHYPEARASVLSR